MQPFSCQHREQHISKQDYEISLVEEINFSKLEPQRFGIEVWAS
jgi:putative NADH-flavin reductase